MFILSTRSQQRSWILLATLVGDSRRVLVTLNSSWSFTGLISRALVPHAKSIVGVDISQASVNVYNETASNQGLSPDEMRAVCTELKGEAGELDGLKFDVVAVSTNSNVFCSGCQSLLYSVLRRTTTLPPSTT